jgi:hypothetical protein
MSAAQQTKPQPTKPQPSKTQPAAKTRSACELITQAEIEQAIGTALSNRQSHKDAEADVCVFGDAQGDQIGIFVSRSNDKRDLNSLVAKTKETLPNAKIRELPGLGQKAILADSPGSATMLSVYRGGDALVVSVTLVHNSAKTDAAAETIARKAYKRF